MEILKLFFFSISLLTFILHETVNFHIQRRYVLLMFDVLNNLVSPSYRRHNLCIVATRRNLLSEADDPSLMQRKYSQVYNVIVDEAQNFKDWDGDWYSLAEKLANQVALGHLHRCCNYFWVFMDYSQKVHKFKAGLPSVIGKNNFMLSEVSRNTKEIFEFTSRLMMASENVEGLCNPYLRQSSVPRLAHNYSAGKGVDILSCQESEIQRILNKVLEGLMQNGVKENDIAILVGRRSELDKLTPSLKEFPDEPSTSKMEREQMDTKRKMDMSERETDVDSACFPYSGMSSAQRKDNFSMGVDNISDQGDHEKDSDQDDNEDNAVSDSEGIEISNKFDVLSSNASPDEFENTDEMISEEEKTGNIDKARDTKADKVTDFFGHDTDSYLGESENNLKDTLVSESDTCTSVRSTPKDSLMKNQQSVAVDTVRGFSGLDKAAVIGINPEVNEDHADFNRFIVSLASRARDNLVIITTSNNVKEQLEKYTQPN